MVRSDLVVLPEPGIDCDLSLFGGVEPFRVEDFFSQGAVKALVVSIFPRAARIDLHWFDAADYTAVTKWAYDSTGYYLLDAKRFKATSEEVEKRILRAAIADQPHRVLIERANHSIDLINRVRSASNGRFQVIEGQHGGLSKEQRFENIHHKINTGQVFLAKGVSGIELFLSELRGFPYGAHDDLVDSFTMALKEMGKGSGRAVWRIS